MGPRNAFLYWRDGDPLTASQSSCDLTIFRWFWYYIWPVQVLVFSRESDTAALVRCFICFTTAA